MGARVDGSGSGSGLTPMLSVSDRQLSHIAASRMTRLVAEQLQKHCAGLLGADANKALTLVELQQHVEAVRRRLRPWHMDGERLVVKYSVGSLMLGQYPDEIEPRMKPTLARDDWSALQKEGFLDQAITVLLGRRQRSAQAGA